MGGASFVVMEVGRRVDESGDPSLVVEGWSVDAEVEPGYEDDGRDKRVKGWSKKRGRDREGRHVCDQKFQWRHGICNRGDNRLSIRPEHTPRRFPTVELVVKLVDGAHRPYLVHASVQYFVRD